MIGRDIIAPYLTKSTNEYFVSCSLTKLVNIIPARAPVGVRKAPMLLPTIDAYTAALNPVPVIFAHKLENKILIGMLLIKLLAKNEEMPYVHTVFVLPKMEAIFSEMPW